MGKRMLAAFGGLAAGAVLTLGVSLPARAASGIFEFTTPGGVQDVLINPNDEVCYSAEIGGFTTNGTNRSAVVYSGANCRGGSRTLPSRSSGNLAGQSVRFVR